MSHLRYIGVLVLALGLVGCGGDGLKRVAIKGKLTAKGQPVDHAGIVFVPTSSSQGLGGTGGTDEQGNFKVRSATVDRRYVDGLVPGDYKVHVSRMVTKDGKPLPDGAKEADNPGCKETVPLKYVTDKSPLKVTVPESGEVTVDIPEPLIKGGVRRR